MVPATFLSSHGAKLQTLVTHFDCAETALNKCPNLKTLAFLPFFVRLHSLVFEKRC